MSEVAEAMTKSADLRGKLLEQYFTLCDARDAVYAKAAPVQAELDKAIAATQACQATEAALAREIESIWGPNWVAMKKEIAQLAAVLGKIPPRA